MMMDEELLQDIRRGKTLRKTGRDDFLASNQTYESPIPPPPPPPLLQPPRIPPPPRPLRPIVGIHPLARSDFTRSQVNQDLLNSLIEMGFKLSVAKTALMAVHNSGILQALDWITSHPNVSDEPEPEKLPDPPPPAPLPRAPRSPDDDKLDEILKREFSCTVVPDQPDLDSFTCPICLDIMNNPVVHPSCGNMFCEGCVKKLTSCPLCRGSVDGSNAFCSVPRLIVHKLSEIKVTCDQCHTEMNRESFYKNHKESCTIPCPFGCGVNVPFTSLKDHCKSGSCKSYSLVCPASIPPLSCDWRGTGGDDYKEHIAHCPLVKLVPYVISTQQTKHVKKFHLVIVFMEVKIIVGFVNQDMELKVVNVRNAVIKIVTCVNGIILIYSQINKFVWHAQMENNLILKQENVKMNVMKDVKYVWIMYTVHLV